MSTANEDQSQLSSNDLGAIIGGCAGGFVAIIIATVFFCIRRRRRRDFYAGRDFPTVTATAAAVAPPTFNDVKHTYPASAVTKGTSVQTHLLQLSYRRLVHRTQQCDLEQ